MKNNNYLLILLGVLCITSGSTVAQVLKVTQSDSLVKDQNADLKANPGDSIRYKVKVIVSGSDADDVILNEENIDGVLTVDPNKLRIGPLARPDSYIAVANIGISINSANGLLANDIDIDAKNDPIKVVKVGAAFVVDKDTSAFFSTGQNSSVKVESNGSFVYDPAAGFQGTDEFYYEISDGDPVTPNVRAKVVILVGGASQPSIWFVDASNGDDATGDGTFAKPYKTLTPLNNIGLDPDQPGDVIYMYSGTYVLSSELVLEDSQSLIGQGVALNLADFGITAPAYSNALPSVGAKPVLSNSSGNGIKIASNNSLKGLKVGDCSGLALQSNGLNSGALKISNFDIRNTIGGGIELGSGSNSQMNISFDDFQIINGSKGIVLNQCSGTFTVLGALGPFIQNTTSEAIKISNCNALVFTYPGALNINSGRFIDLLDNTGASSFNFSQGDLSSTTGGGGIVFSNNTGANIILNNPNITVSPAATNAIDINNNSGATITFNQSGNLVLSTTSTHEGIKVNDSGSLTISKGSVSSVAGAAVSINQTLLNVDLESVSSNGAPQGIYLANTSGTFEVKGDGSNNRNSSGGTIQGSTVDGVYLENALGVSLSNLTISGSMRHGIFSTSSKDLNLTACSITSNGNAPDEHGINLLNFSATSESLIQNCLIEGSAENNVNVVNNSSASGQNLRINNSIIQKVPDLYGSNGIYVESGTGSNTQITVSGSQIIDNYGAGLNAQSINGGTINVTINDNIFNSGITASYQQANGIFIAANSGSNVSFNVDDNKVLASSANGIKAVGNFSTAFSGVIQNNLIDPGTNGNGIDVRTNGTAQGTVEIKGNTLNNTLAGVTNNTSTNSNGNGLYLRSDEGTGNLHAEISNNTVVLSDAASLGYGLFAKTGSTSGALNTLCLNISGNDISQAGFGEEYYLEQYTGTTFSLEGLSTSPETVAANVESFLIGLDSGSTAEVREGGSYIVNYTNNVCNTLP